MSDIKCEYEWNAPRVPTPGIPPNHVTVTKFGVVVNATSVPQECCLPAGHDGPHRSTTGVVGVQMADRPGERLRFLAEQIMRPDAPVLGGEAEELARGVLGLLDEADRLTARLSEGNDYKRLLWEEEQAHDRTAKEAEARLSDYEQALRGLIDAATVVWNHVSLRNDPCPVEKQDALLDALADARAVLVAGRAALSGSAGNERKLAMEKEDL